MYRLKDKPGHGDICFLDAVSSTMVELADADDRVVAFDADLVACSGFKKLQEKYPEKVIDCGIQEANMIGAAAGASAVGIIPFTHTFSAFAARKCFDQIYLAACYSRLNVKMLASDPGICAKINGGSHTGLEDMGALMAFYNITLIDASDPVQLKSVLKTIKDEFGVHYVRVDRRGTPSIYEEGSEFEIGKGVVLREGKDVTIIASGIEVLQALEAYDILKARGIEARVIDMFTWKPLDEELIINSARETGAIVTAENHQIANGLGAAVAATVCREYPVPMRYIGADCRYGEVGPIEYLLEEFHMTGKYIAQKAIEVIALKK